ncbi:MAG: hypothetical protein V7K54_09900 [Nostoc sp.]
MTNVKYAVESCFFQPALCQSCPDQGLFNAFEILWINIMELGQVGLWAMNGGVGEKQT